MAEPFRCADPQSLPAGQHGCPRCGSGLVRCDKCDRCAYCPTCRRCLSCTAPPQPPGVALKEPEGRGAPNEGREPESAAEFWAAINRTPADAVLRLQFARWCERRGDVVLGTVQRWLAATERRPEVFQSGAALWWSAAELEAWYRRTSRQTFYRPDPADYQRTRHSALQRRLFRALPRADARKDKHGKDGSSESLPNLSFPSLQAAETALVVAWGRVTRPSRWWEVWRKAWIPGCEPVLP